MSPRRRHDHAAATCRCGTPTPNGEQTCETCLNQLDTAIGDLAWLADELESAISLPSRSHDPSIVRPDAAEESVLPFNDRASRTQRRLHHTLARWIRKMHDAGVVHQSPHPGLPRPADDPTRWTITAMSHWLAWRVDGLAHHRMGHAAMVEITNAVASATQTVLWSSRERVFLGPCDMHAICDGEIWADVDAERGACNSCGAQYHVDKRRADLEARLDARLCPASEIADFAITLGLNLNRQQIRKRINQWHHRKVIVPVTRDPHSGEPLFRYGDVRPLLTRDETRPTPRSRAQ